MDLLQILGTAAMCTFAWIIARLSWPDQNQLFKEIGQTVFRWMFFVLVPLIAGRTAVAFFGLSTDLARYINSVAFLIAVTFISIEVVKQTKRVRKNNGRAGN